MGDRATYWGEGKVRCEELSDSPFWERGDA
jgi:hypothetical protein